MNNIAQVRKSKIIECDHQQEWVCGRKRLWARMKKSWGLCDFFILKYLSIVKLCCLDNVTRVRKHKIIENDRNQKGVWVRDKAADCVILFTLEYLINHESKSHEYENTKLRKATSSKMEYERGRNVEDCMTISCSNNLSSMKVPSMNINTITHSLYVPNATRVKYKRTNTHCDGKVPPQRRPSYFCSTWRLRPPSSTAKVMMYSTLRYNERSTSEKNTDKT